MTRARETSEAGVALQPLQSFVSFLGSQPVPKARPGSLGWDRPSRATWKIAVTIPRQEIPPVKITIWLPAVCTGIHRFQAKFTGKIGKNPEKI